MHPLAYLSFARNNVKRIGVLYSGGLDSAALIYHLLQAGFEVWPVYIQCGLPWERAETYWAKKFLKSITHPRLHHLSWANLILENAYARNWSKTGKTPGSHSRDEAVFLPARNLLLVIKSVLVLTNKNISQLALATLRGNPFPDAKPSYFRSVGNILSASFGRRIRILTPFRHSNKVEIIQQAKNCSLRFSFSCINPKGIYHCGKCNKCGERIRAFKQAGVEDRTIYKRS